ncbi:hypothetical protein HMPREF0290_1902 [Corynebacterium efficiens YS-314]|nr:hypothetical protein HMPREF0290_1902 [Corynebacterium efficiens YS-314]
MEGAPPRFPAVMAGRRGGFGVPAARFGEYNTIVHSENRYWGYPA